MNHEDKIIWTGARRQRSCKTCRIGSAVPGAQDFLPYYKSIVCRLCLLHRRARFSEQCIIHSISRSNPNDLLDDICAFIGRLNDLICDVHARSI